MVEEIDHVPLGQPQVRLPRRVERMLQLQVAPQARQLEQGTRARLRARLVRRRQVHDRVEDRAP